MGQEFDEGLTQRLRAFQEHHGLTCDGVAGAQTWARLVSGHGGQQIAGPNQSTANTHQHPTLRKGVSSEWVLYLQQLMQHRGVWSGPLNGTFDDALEQAVQVVQANSGLPRTGVVDRATWDAIDRLRPQQHAPTTGGRSSTSRSVANMTVTQKLVEAFNRADIDSAVREKILSVLSPESLVAAILVFAALELTPVGWAADLVLAFTVAFAGSAVLSAASHLVDFAAARNATTSEELDVAGQAFARAVAEIEVDAFLFLVTRSTGGTGGGRPYNGPRPNRMVLAATPSGQAVVVVAETVPATVAGELPMSVRPALMSTGGGGRRRGGGRGDDASGERRGRRSPDDEPEEAPARERRQAERERDRQRQSRSTEDPVGEQLRETFATLPEALPGLPGPFVEVQRVPTESAGLRVQGFTETVYVVDATGRQWTVYHNPSTRRFGGRHPSSSN